MKPRDEKIRPAAHTGKPPAAAGKKPTHWDNVAEWYDTLVGDEGSEYHRKIILPGVLRMLAQAKPSADPNESKGGEATFKNLAGMRVLDLACGQGVLCRQLAAHGAKVTGIDAAPALLEAARRREKEAPAGVQYVEADVTKLSPLPSPLSPSSFDAVTMILSIQNVTPLSPIWQACHAALVPGGRLVIAMMHPCFRVLRKSGWHWDEATAVQTRTVTDYLTSSKAEIQMKPGEASVGGAGVTTTSFHRPLQAYVNTLSNAGLLIDHMSEWPSHRKPPAGIRFAALDKARREIPLFMAIRARKVS
jgi:2-polyprenyl-3-methyl-5-hydroxy-6-metoxy-1,4-benzoquinol methylase